MATKTKDISLYEFMQKFGTKEKCIEHIQRVRWPDEIICPHCGGSNPYLTNRGYKCSKRTCKKKFSNISQTVFENTKIALPAWFLLMYMMASNRKSISSVQIGKNLGITQASAWKIMHKLRLVFEEKNTEQLSGIVEIDECFIGKGNLWSRWGAVSTRKTPIVGMLQRGGRVIMKCVDGRDHNTLTKIVIQFVAPGSAVYTDGWLGYSRLKQYYEHEAVNHSNREYVRGNIHINGIESVWGYFKKNIRNGHHYISGKHVQRYCNEVSWKFNNRQLTTMQRFNEILKRCLESKQLVVEFKKASTLRAA